MNTKIIIPLVIVLILVVAYVVTRPNTDVTMIQGNENSMIMSEEEGTPNTMMSGGHTMSDGTVMQGTEMDTMAEGHMMPGGIKMGGTMPKEVTPVAAAPIMDHTMMGYGTYVAYDASKVAGAGTEDIVLFFRAAWCSTCKALHSDLKLRLMDIPQNVTILDVNYDTEIALKEKYGVTYQHTFVQVDTKGNQIAKWSGSRSLSELLTSIK